jgi:uncharacterized phage protein gp47/JayE
MSSYSYISYPIETSPQDLLDEMIAYIKSKAPSWVENDANLDVWIMQIVASQAGDLRTLASDVPDTIFRYFGSTLLGLAPIDDIAAATTSVWTMRDNAGYTVPAGTFVTIRDDAGNDFAFQTEVDVVIFAGSTTAGSVRLVATQPGLAGSGLGSPGGPVNLLDTLDFVASITQDDVTSGGSDAETASDYNDRLARHLRRLSTRPILPVDFETLALDIPGVYRAICIDLYNPADHTTNNARMVALSCIDELGNNLDGATKALIDATVQANREVNFICNMMDPNRSNIDVTYNAVSVASYDANTVKSAINTAIAAYLDPANWGRDPQYTDASAAQTWIQVDKVYYFEMAQLISNVEGVSRLVSLSMGIHGGSMASADVALTTPATLTSCGTLTGTVT